MKSSGFYKVLPLTLIILISTAPLTACSQRTPAGSPQLGPTPLGAQIQKRLLQLTQMQPVRSRANSREELGITVHNSPSTSALQSACASCTQSPLTRSRSATASSPATPSGEKSKALSREEASHYTRIILDGAWQGTGQRQRVKAMYDLLTSFPPELISIINRYLDPTLGTTQTLADHSSTITALTKISDTDFASASRDGIIKLWSYLQNTHQWSCQKSLAVAPCGTHPRFITSLLAIQSTASEKQIAAGDDNGKIFIVQSSDNKQIRLEGHHDKIIALKPLPGPLLTFISASQDNSLRIWKKVGTPERWQCVCVHMLQASLRSYFFISDIINTCMTDFIKGNSLCGFDSGLLAITSHQNNHGTDQLSLQETLTKDSSTHCKDDTITSCAISPLGNFIVGNNAGIIFFIDGTTLQPIKQITMEKAPIIAMATLTTEILVIAQNNALYLLHNPEKNSEKIFSPITNTHTNNSTQMIAVNNQLVTTSENAIKVWD